MIPYIGTLIGPNGVRGRREFWAKNDDDAWSIAHEQVDPLNGGWVEVKRMNNPQESLNLDQE